MMQTTRNTQQASQATANRSSGEEMLGTIAKEKTKAIDTQNKNKTVAKINIAGLIGSLGLCAFLCVRKRML
jgi:hypothetical protein